jgi:2-desacetyl-2-hydroxyethyl bacteriochlorophyllide A dehydrogenase
MRNVGIEYTAKGQMDFYDLGPLPDLGPSEVLVRTQYSGITNGTERHSLMGEHGWAGAFPSRNGYQHVGRIEAVGSDVSEFKVDDCVFYGHYVGHRAWNVIDVGDGDSQSNASHLCKVLPDDVDHRHCALLGVAGVALRGIRRCRVSPAQNVWVVGGGPIGQFAAQSARAFGARVTVSEIDSRRLEVAGKLGAHRLIDSTQDTAIDQLKEGAPYDCIIDTSGIESLFFDIAENWLLSHGGVMGALAVRSVASFPWSLMHGHEASIEVSCHFGLDDLRVLLHFMQQNEIRVEPLISHVVSVDDASDIYMTMRDRPADLLGVVFEWAT